MAKMRNIIRSSAEYTESFSGFRGIAPEGDNTVKSRLGYCENVYRDYEGDNPAAITSVPGYRRAIDFESRVQDIFRHFDRLAVHSGSILYVLSDADDGTAGRIPLGALAGKIQTTFPFEEYTYILGGSSISRIHKDASLELTIQKSPTPYRPILYLNGVAFESRNLLTDGATEEYDIIDGRENAMESESLRYSILDANALTCAVSGADSTLQGEVDVPGFKRIGGVLYRVEEISDKAFINNQSITSVRIGEGVRRIGKMAFYGCSALERVSTPASLHFIDDAAFNSCISLSEVYLRSGLSRIGSAAFSASLNLSLMHYEGNATEYENIDGIEGLGAAEKLFTSVDESTRICLPIMSKFESIDLIEIDGKPVEAEIKYKNGIPVGIILTPSKHWEYNGSRVSIHGTLPELLSSFNGSDEVGEISGRGIIEGCTISALYDGRVFLSGNPLLPATVFYCSRTRDGTLSPLYFGEHNYFNDGSKSIGVSALLSVGDGIYVFKKENDPMGSIFYHRAEDTGIDVLPRIYPIHEAFSGDSCLGASITSPDAPLFLSPRGLSAIEKESTNLEKSINTRSSNIISRLLGEELSRVQIFNWMGYIALCVGAKIYLADTRATFVGRNGNTEYEWFIINGVGAYSGKSQIYRYASYVTDPVLNLRTDAPDQIVKSEVLSYVKEGKTYYFTYENKTQYAVYPTEEYTYSDFAEAERFATVKDRLYFKAERSVFVFNNDRRSIPLSAEYLKKMGLTEAEYRELYGRRLYPSLYNFDGIAPRYVIRTVRTDCGVPHLTKNSVKGSLTIKLGRLTDALPSCKVTTDKGSFSEFVKIGGGCICFTDLDFSRLSLTPEADQTVSVAEKEKDWVEKDIVIYSEGTSSPISVHGITFRYKIKGRIKHT